jgi:hypothetical protein
MHVAHLVQKVNARVNQSFRGRLGDKTRQQQQWYMTVLVAALRFGDQGIENSSVKVRPLLFDPENVDSVGSAHLQNAVCPRIDSTVLSGKVEALYEGQALDLFQKGID